MASAALTTGAKVVGWMPGSDLAGGASLLGSGLERVVADAREEAERVRRAALFGAPRAI